MSDESTTPTQALIPVADRLPEKFIEPNFYLVESFVYLAQLFTFFLVAVMTSNMLRDEQSLLAYVASKITESALTDAIATMLAVAATFGIVAAIARSFPKSPVVERLVDEVLAEAPRTAYVFGSAVSGTLFAVALYLRNNPEPYRIDAIHVFLVGLLWASVGFMYGLFFSYAFKKNRRTVVEPIATYPEDPFK